MGLSFLGGISMVWLVRSHEVCGRISRMNGVAVCARGIVRPVMHASYALPGRFSLPRRRRAARHKEDQKCVGNFSPSHNACMPSTSVELSGR
jgi:hypothetical protein